jgi:hypothetical protein
LPPTAVRVSVNGRQFVRGFDAPSSGREPRLHLAVGQSIALAVWIKAPVGVYVGDVWLTVNAYPSGFGYGRPTGKFRLLKHVSGRVSADQAITASWTATRLFDADALDLTIEFTLGDAGVGSPLAHVELTS